MADDDFLQGVVAFGLVLLNNTLPVQCHSSLELFGFFQLLAKQLLEMLLRGSLVDAVEHLVPTSVEVSDIVTRQVALGEVIVVALGGIDI